MKSFGAAKQRLAGSLGAGSRQALAQAMFIDVLITLRRVPGLDGVAVVTRTTSPRRSRPAATCACWRTRAGGPVGGGADRDPPCAGRGLRARRARARRHPARAAGRARRPDGRGAASRSSPTGTAPAPTRWCSRRPTRSSRASARAASRATWRPRSGRRAPPRRGGSRPRARRRHAGRPRRAGRRARAPPRPGAADPRRAPPARPRGRALCACRRPRPDRFTVSALAPLPAIRPGTTSRR